MLEYPVFTESMKKTHTILIPDMLPVHFTLFTKVFGSYGYNMELLTTSTRTVIDEGLKNVHNDTCYPALLVIGQFMEALKSGRYDVNKVALMITQTGGGCRASNYIHLLRKTLKDTFPQVPVISLNFSGLDKGSAFQITAPMFLKLLYAILYGDMLMVIYNQCKPYELVEGESDRVRNKLIDTISNYFISGNEYTKTKKIYALILDSFAKVERSKDKKIKVGIVGEIYVKYSPLANNHLEEFLISEGCEPVVPTLLEFCLYCAISTVNDGHMYNFFNKSVFAMGIGYNVILAKHREFNNTIKNHGVFTAPHDFEHLRTLADKFINQGVHMGEGWLITAEMGALIESGTENVICTQPFGCLPNHIVAKGMSRVIKNAYPQANLVAIDYDPGATKVNQENRIKLMLANAKDKDAILV
ncbi:MAG: 2-hydroxyacyl-CoA dehydratase [Ruminococcus sp.]|nr:2-hydroxyacyl-CoA dehydratase [Ruminococcus sp.]MCD7799905.1 2-hydroxyacyl-CoA dehydratase [Ruminococcus sp.]